MGCGFGGSAADSLGFLYLGGVGRGVQDFRALWLALLTGLCIASYSMVDVLGARVAGTGGGFFWDASGIGWADFCRICSLALSAHLAIAADRWAARFSDWRLIVFIAYCLVVWACTQAPIAIVSALREKSVIFALVLGGVFLREKIGGGKIIATLVVLRER